MKINKEFVNVSDIPWERVTDSVVRKVLNGSGDHGPHTAILKSEPRSPDPHRGQYHLVDEEFYCLGGHFTFDGEHWLRKGAYVHYPAKCVHGARVHVKDGYLVYLRMGGTVTVNFIDDPVSDSPYMLDDADTLMTPTVRKRVSMAGKDTKLHALTGLRSRLLKLNPETGEGSTLLDWKPEKGKPSICLKSQGELELFVISGQFDGGTKTPVEHGAYTCRVGKNVSIQLSCLTEGRLLVSHGAELQLDQV